VVEVELHDALLLVPLGDTVAAQHDSEVPQLVDVQELESEGACLVLVDDAERQLLEVHHLDHPDVVLELVLVEQDRHRLALPLVRTHFEQSQPLRVILVHDLRLSHEQFLDIAAFGELKTLLHL